MDENLQRLVRELRKEVCPRRVHDEVARRLSIQAPARGQSRYGLALAAAAVVVLCCLVWRWPGRDARQPQVAGDAVPNRAQVVAQAEQALGFIGGVLLEASIQSERTIFEEAVPPLRNRLETTKDKIIQLIQL